MGNFLQRSPKTSWNTLTSVVSGIVFKGVCTYRFANIDKHFVRIPGKGLHVHMSQRRPQQGRNFLCRIECSEALAFFFLLQSLFLLCFTPRRFFSFFFTVRHCCLRCLSFRLAICFGVMFRNRLGFFMVSFACR